MPTDQEIQTRLKINSATWVAVGVVGWVGPALMSGFGWITDQQTVWTVGTITVIALVGCHFGRKAAYRD